MRVLSNMEQREGRLYRQLSPFFLVHHMSKKAFPESSAVAKCTVFYLHWVFMQAIQMLLWKDASPHTALHQSYLITHKSSSFPKGSAKITLSLLHLPVFSSVENVYIASHETNKSSLRSKLVLPLWLLIRDTQQGSKMVLEVFHLV